MTQDEGLGQQAQQQQQQQQPPPLPLILSHSSSSTPPLLIAQGAEGRLYRTTYLHKDIPCALKYRPSKAYRHPILDARLTKARILAEARVLVRCRREGVDVPAVYAVDEANGWLMMEWITGEPVRKRINAWLGSRQDNPDPTREALGAGRDAAPFVRLMRRIGSAIGRLHATGIVHGDLTTSNLMLRPSAAKQQQQQQTNSANTRATSGDEASGLEGDIVIIDLGLATQSSLDEDRAVDLYVLERAFASTHPRAQVFFDEVLGAYGETMKQPTSILKKLENVRMRGRKRGMLG